MTDNGSIANPISETCKLRPQGNNEQAMQNYVGMLEKNPRDWRTWWELARVAKEIGNTEMVDQCCDNVLLLNPDFWFARELPKHARGYYSQLGQDKVIESYFDGRDDCVKFFVEVGAFDGVHYSNVRRMVEKYGWSGISIEPVEKNYIKLRHSYENTPICCIRAAVAEEDGETEINVATYPQLPDWGSDISSLNEGETGKWSNYGAIWEKQKVPVKRLTTILEDNNVEKIDLLSVDAEGYDLNVLKSLDFSRYKPQMIVVEYGEERESIISFLQQMGYRLYHDNQQDSFFVFDKSLLKNPIHLDMDVVDGIINTTSYAPHIDFNQILSNPLISLEQEMLQRVNQIPGWFTLDEAVALNRMVSFLPDDARILELGSYRGRSTNAIGCAIKKTGRKLTCLDVWCDFDKQGLLEKDPTSSLLPPTDQAVFDDFLKNIEWFHENVTVLKGETARYANEFPQETFDLIFIDAAHDYENVCRDIRICRPWLKRGGVICGHDYQSNGGQDVIRAVNELIGSDKDFSSKGVFPNTSIWYAQYDSIARRDVIPNESDSPRIMNDITNHSATPNKIVALIPARNEEAHIEFCLRAVANFADAICVYDDASDDNTAKIVESLAKELSIERIIRNAKWEYNETNYRQALLDAGRVIGGTHFIVMDADEAFTSNFMDNDGLRQVIHALRPGDQLAMPWFQLWRTSTLFRNDNSIWTNNLKPFVFADDGACYYHQQAMHLGRVPDNLHGQTYSFEGLSLGMMHFQFVDWENVLLKQAWYRCLEHIRDPKKSIDDINTLYRQSLDEEGLAVSPVPADWLKGYCYFDEKMWHIPDNWRRQQVLGWFKEHENDFFAELDVWNIEWEPQPDIELSITDITDNPIRVSAIVSTYKSERFMRGCLEDLVNQTLYKKNGLEIVVIDACSPEDEGAIVQEFQAKYENIRYIRTEERIPLYQAWNIGIQNARGEYISNANTDDRHAPEMLERLVNELDGHRDIGLVYADCLISKTENATFDTPHAVGIFTWKEHNHAELLKACYIGPQPVWRRSLHDTCGYFDEDYISAGDYEFWLRLSANQIKFKHVPQTLGLYLENPASISLGYSNINWEESEKARSKYQYGLNERSTIVPQWNGENVSVSANEMNDHAPPFPRKVLLMCDYFWPSVGGVELYVQDLGKHLILSNYVVDIGARWLSSRETNEYEGMRIHSFKCDGSHGEGNVCFENERYRKVIMQGGYDVVFALTQPDNWVAQGLLNLPEGHPRIYLMPSINQQNITEWNSHGSLINIVNTLRSMNGLISVTENGLDAKILQAAHLSSVFIPHAVEHDAVSQNFREAFNLDKNRPLLVMVANYWPVKNHLALLQTLEGIKGDWQLILIGNPTNHFPDYHKQVLMQASRDPRVRVLGGLPREIAASAIRDADILLVPSRGESAGPLVVLQAMSYGTPWIATPECNGVHDEAGGVIADLGQFPSEINALLSSPDIRSELGQLGQEHWSARFTWEKSIYAFANIIENGNVTQDFKMPDDLRKRNQMIVKSLNDETVDSIEDFPMFSVIIPTHNRSEILKGNLDALSLQSYPKDRFEVIVCDDGSMDDTSALLAEYDSPYNLISVRQKNLGAGSARNRAIRLATGEYLLILNDDVVSDKDLIEQHLMEHKKRNDKNTIVVGSVQPTDIYANRVLSKVLESYGLLFPHADKREEETYDHNMFVTANISMRKDIFVKDGFWFDENFHRWGCEDIELGYRLFTHGAKIYYQPKAKVTHNHWISIENFIQREKDNSSNLLYFTSKYPELTPMYFGVEKLNENILSEWQDHIEMIKSNVPIYIDHISKIEKESIDHTANELMMTYDQVMSKIYQELFAIKEYVTATNIIQILKNDFDHHQNKNLGNGSHSQELHPDPAEKEPSCCSDYQPGLTSIIILNLNGGAYTQSCIESIRKHTDSRHEIIVVDNGSTDDSKSYLRSMQDIILIENNDNIGAPMGRNQGISISKGEYIVFLDNDTLVTEGWIDRIIRHFNDDPTLGAIGPMSNFAANSQLVRDAYYNNWMELDGFASRWFKEHEGGFTYSSRLILFCILVKREIVHKIGGIDPIYGKGGWEDDDLSLRIQIAGYRLGIADDVYIHHFGNQTSKSSNIDYNDLYRKNWEVFRKKWNIPWQSIKPIKYNELELIKASYDPLKHRVALPLRQDIERLIYKHNSHEIANWNHALSKQLVFEFMNKQNWLEAIRISRESLKESPDDWELKNALATALLKTGESEEAKKLLQEGIESAPEKRDFNAKMASALLDEGDTLNALEYVLQAVNS